LKLVYPLAVTVATLFVTVPGQAAKSDDDRIETAAKNSYVFRTYLKDDNIHLDAKDGMVTLKGKVANASHRSMAEDTVENLPGVTGVNNQLEVKNKPDEKSDEWIQFKIK